MSEARRWGIGKKLLLQAVLIPSLLLVGEFAYRAWARGDRPPREDVPGVMERTATAVEVPLLAFAAGPTDAQKQPRRIPSPFYGWEHDNSIPSIESLRRYFKTPQGQKSYDILVLGGSVAGGFANQGGPRLAEVLGRDPRFAGRPINVIGWARGGYKQPQQLNFLVYVLGLGWEPDAVVCLDGFNEVAIGTQNAALRAHPLHPSIPHWGHLLAFGRMGFEELEAMWTLREAKLGPRRVLERFERLGLGWSAVASDRFLDLSRAARGDYLTAHNDYQNAVSKLGQDLGLYGPLDPSPSLEARLAMVADAWASASRSMQAICDDQGVFLVHALQPTLHDTGSKPLTEQEIRTGGASPQWEDGARVGYPLLRAAGRQLQSEGVNFIGGSMAFETVEQSLYVDPCHFTAEGQEILAEYIAARFLETLPQD